MHANVSSEKFRQVCNSRLPAHAQYPDSLTTRTNRIPNIFPKPFKMTSQLWLVTPLDELKLMQLPPNSGCLTALTFILSHD